MPISKKDIKKFISGKLKIRKSRELLYYFILGEASHVLAHFLPNSTTLMSLPDPTRPRGSLISTQLRNLAGLPQLSFDINHISSVGALQILSENISIVGTKTGEIVVYRNGSTLSPEASNAMITTFCKSIPIYILDYIYRTIINGEDINASLRATRDWGYDIWFQALLVSGVTSYTQFIFRFYHDVDVFRFPGLEPSSDGSGYVSRVPDISLTNPVYEFDYVIRYKNGSTLLRKFRKVGAAHLVPSAPCAIMESTKSPALLVPARSLGTAAGPGFDRIAAPPQPPPIVSHVGIFSPPVMHLRAAAAMTSPSFEDTNRKKHTRKTLAWRATCLRRTDYDKFAQITDDKFLCKITLEVPKIPVLLGAATLYDLDAITRWINEHHTDPADPSEAVYLDQLQPDLGFFDKASEYLDRLEFKPIEREVIFRP